MSIVGQGAKRKITLTELNMTPMIDCVFLLLLFFMVGMKFKELDRRLDTDLPKAGKPRPEDPTELKTELWIRITVKRGTHGYAALPQYTVDQVAMRDAEHLRNTLRRCAAVPGAVNDPVIMDPSDDAHHGWVMTALDYLHEMRFRSINFKQ
ncbi:MAG TPA: biopolymer transporter ExbD [Planctomycetota bacterium]|nr:biopolymer transporter ExbD [Planctomycetota bacterium]